MKNKTTLLSLVLNYTRSCNESCDFGELIQWLKDEHNYTDFYLNQFSILIYLILFEHNKNISSCANNDITF